MTSLILVAHGSRHPAAADAVWALARRVAVRLDGARVRTAFLDAEVPRLPAALAKEAGLAQVTVTVVPTLLAAGHHARTRIPDEIGAALRGGLPLSVRLADGLGPIGRAEPTTPGMDLLVGALLRRLDEAMARNARPNGAGDQRPDAIILAAAGSRSTRAMQTASAVARAVSLATGTPCRAAFTTNGLSIGEAVHSARQRGASRIAVATYLLAPGVLAERVLTQSTVVGVLAVSGPLTDAPELAELIVARATTAELYGSPARRG